MPTNDEIRQNVVDTTQRLVDELYQLITPGTPIEYKSETLAERLGMTRSMAEDRCQTLQQLGILTRTISYGKKDPDGTWHVGRWAAWDLHMSLDEARQRVATWGAQVRNGEAVTASALKNRKTRAKQTKPKDPTNYKTQPRVAPGGPIERVIPVVTLSNTSNSNTETVTLSNVTVTTSPKEDTKAIAGPNAPKTLSEALRPARKADDATALIAAARQYANRSGQIADHVAALKATAKELGIEIDEAVFTAGIKLAVDERLETVSLVLPVIDALEAKVERQGNQIADMREKVKAADTLANENRRLRVRVESLISERVTNQQRQHAQA